MQTDSNVLRILVACLPALLAQPAFCAPSPWLMPDRPQGVYAAGETVRWKLADYVAPTGAVREARYTIKSGGLTVVGEGVLPVVSNGVEIVASLDAPNSLLVEATLPGPTGTTVRASGGALVAPERIAPSMPRPDDFDAFWDAKLAELAQVPVNPRLEAVETGIEGVDYWKVALDNIRGTTVHGQLARPAKGDKLPALLIVQWAGVYPLQKGWVTDRAREGWLTFNINAHDLPIDQPEAFYAEQKAGALKDYPGIGNDDRETSYFLRMYLSCCRAVDYLVERDDWDGRTLVVTGGSQGGLQALMVAGLRPRVSAVLACVPAGCDMTGPVVGREPGWPKWHWKVQGRDADKVRTASRYYDVVNFASRIQCPVLVGFGLLDRTCPSAGVMAALNQIPSAKESVILPRGEHQDRHGAHARYYARFGAWLAALRRGQPVPVAAP